MAGLAPAGVPPDALDTARETLGGAIVISGQLPKQVGTSLLDAARMAFTNGIHAAAITGVIIMAAAAILSVALVQRVRVDSPSSHQDVLAQQPPPRELAAEYTPDDATSREVSG